MLSVSILVTGGLGRLGRELARLRPFATLAGRELLDVTSEHDCRWCQHFDLIIHCAGVMSVEAQRDCREAAAVNVEGTWNVVRNTKTRLVFISSDYVFGDDGSFHEESDLTNPVNIYGETKAEAEKIVSRHPTHLILRAPFRYWPWSYDNACIDQWSSSRWISEVAPDIVRAALSPLTGILHIGGERRSVYEMVSQAGFKVRESRRSEITSVPLPRDTSLDSTRWRRFIGAETVSTKSESAVC